MGKVIFDVVAAAIGKAFVLLLPDESREFWRDEELTLDCVLIEEGLSEL